MDTRFIETIEHLGQLLAVVIRDGFRAPGVTFVTSGDLSQQVAVMSHPPGKRIGAHKHRPVPREVLLTQEVLIIRRGKLRVDLFDDGARYLESRVLGPGDTIVLVGGGHGFEVLEELEMLEVKQGPYAGDADKVRFEPDAFQPRIPSAG
jgi:mannose-6-phosphate isomerase-like protein (cupin superfamily)